MRVLLTLWLFVVAGAVAVLTETRVEDSVSVMTDGTPLPPPRP